MALIHLENASEKFLIPRVTSKMVNFLDDFSGELHFPLQSLFVFELNRALFEIDILLIIKCKGLAKFRARRA